MLLLWEYGPCPVKTLIDHMPEPKPHFNTISTFIHILEQKGYVDRIQNGPRSYSYFATLPKSNYRSKVVRKVARDYFGSCFSMVSQLVSDKEITPGQLRELLDLIDKQKD